MSRYRPQCSVRSYPASSPARSSASRDGMTPWAIVWAVMSIVASLACLVLAGSYAWTLVGPHMRMPQVDATYFAADTSDSTTRDERIAYINAVNHSRDALLPSGSTFVISRFDGFATELYRGAPSSSKDLYQAEEAIINARPDGRGTRPDLALKDIADEIEASSGGAGARLIVMGWDGDDSEPSATLAQMRRLAANPHTILWVMAVPANENLRLREHVKDVARAFGDRAIVSGRLDAKEAIERLRGLLRRFIQ